MPVSLVQEDVEDLAGGAPGHAEPAGSGFPDQVESAAVPGECAVPALFGGPRQIGDRLRGDRSRRRAVRAGRAEDLVDGAVEVMCLLDGLGERGPQVGSGVGRSRPHGREKRHQAQTEQRRPAP